MIQYDSDFRITTITDAISQVSTVSYVSNTSSNPGFYKIAGIQDPFGRSFALTYDAAVENLIEVPDVIGMKSQFAWDTGTSFISQMTTEYGTTSFYNYVPGVDLVPARGLRFTLPDKSAYVIENWLNEPKSTYIWDLPHDSAVLTGGDIAAGHFFVGGNVFFTEMPNIKYVIPPRVRRCIRKHLCSCNGAEQGKCQKVP